MVTRPLLLSDVQRYMKLVLQWALGWDWRAALHFLNPLHWILAPILGAVIFVVRKAVQRSREGRAAAWPSTDAAVLATSVKASSGYWVEVQYRYFARDEYRYGTYRRQFRRKPPAEEFAAAVSKLQVPIHFSEEDPNRSVLIERDLQFAGQMSGSLEPR